MNIYLESLGCAKNHVDSEIMMGRLAAAGLSLCDTPGEAQILIVNTCSFIEPAVNEALDTILTLARLKKTGSCRRLIVCGCLAERYREDLAESLPEVDCFLGTGAFDRIVEAVFGPHLLSGCILPAPEMTPLETDLRIRASAPSVYLKISEGCDRNCTYCIIPRLRGRQRSRSPEHILQEAKRLIAEGARELVLVSQETSSYGHDLTPPLSLSRLLADLSDLSDQIWIRLLYLHPESLARDAIHLIGERENICAYFDIPIQHASDSLLKKMGRRYTAADLYLLFAMIRETIPAATLRTTVLVGFPGESAEDFQKLMNFIRKIQFDHLGVFVYSDADDLPSHCLGGHVPEQTSEQRYEALMSAQAAISLAKNTSRTGNRYDILVEERLEPGIFAGRTRFQAPEVDGLTCFSGPPTTIPGAFVPVRITAASEYDLTGEVA